MKRLIISTLLSLLCICCSEGSFVDSEVLSGDVEDVVDGSDDVLTELVAVEIESSISTSTRVDGISWEDGDEIGVFMTYFGHDVELVNNVCYTTTGDGKFSPTKESDIIYYPENTSTVDLYAYYPYSSSVGSFGEMEINISSINQYNSESIDILRAYFEGVKMDERETPVLFTFEHRLSKIDIVTYPGVGYTIASLADMSVSITEQSHKATYVAYTDELTLAGGGSEIELVTTGPTTDSSNAQCYSSTAIIFPQTASGDCVLRFDLDNGDSFSLSLSGEEIESGDNLLLNVSVNRHGIETISSSIVAWGESEEHFGVDYEYVPIWNEADLIAYREVVNSGGEVSPAILMSDIELSTLTNWTPIGNNIYPYTSTFNGNGKSISGLTILDANSSCQGLFGVVGDGITEAYIGDLIISSPNVVVGGSCGAVAGMSNNATFVRCSVDGGIVSGGDYSGGVIGVAVSTILQYCSSTSTLSDGVALAPLVGSLRDCSIF